MKILVLKSDIKTRNRLNELTPIFSDHPGIKAWNVDFQDLDHVLRIEANDNLSEKEIQKLLKPAGVNCQPLPD